LQLCQRNRAHHLQLLIKLSDLLSPPAVRAETVSVDRDRQKLWINVQSQGHTIIAHFEARRDFSVTIYMLEQIGFPINHQSALAIQSDSVQHGALPLEFHSDPPRLSSITQLTRLPSLYDFGQPPMPNPGTSIGDLCFSPQPEGTSSQALVVPGLMNQGSRLQSGQDQALSTAPNTTSWPPATSYPNPYHLFGTGQHYENYIPRVASPLRHALPTRGSSMEGVTPQLHADIVSRRASFTMGAPSPTHYEEAWAGQSHKPMSSSQPAAQLSHYFPSGGSPASSQSTELSNQSVETPPSFRDALPQPRSLPFHQQSDGLTKKPSASELKTKQLIASIQPESSTGSPSDQKQSQKKASTKVKSTSKVGSYQIRGSDGTGSSKPSKKRVLENSTSTSSGGNTVVKATLKRIKIAKASDSRVAAQKPRSRPDPKLSESSLTPANRTKKPAPTKTATLTKETTETTKPDAKPGTRIVVSNEDLQNRLPTTRRVTRRVLRDAGGISDQLAQINAEEIPDSQECLRLISSNLIPIRTLDKAGPSHRDVGSQRSAEHEGSNGSKSGSAQKASNLRQESKFKETTSKNPDPQVKRKDRGSKRSRITDHHSVCNQSDKATRERLTESSNLANSRAHGATPGSSSSNNRRKKESVQHTMLDVIHTGQDWGQIFLVGDGMLREVNEASWMLLDQYKADVERGGDEEELALFYYEQLHVARQDKWQALLLEQGA
jgi:hypothetical protein